VRSPGGGGHPALTAIDFQLVRLQTVGKTALIVRYTSNLFVADTTTTTYIDWRLKTVPLGIEGQPVSVVLWDTAGQERFRQNLSPDYMRKAHGLALVFDVTSWESAESVFRSWLPEVREKRPGLPLVLLANKMDLAHAAGFDAEEILAMGRQRAAAEGLPLFETSALTGDGVAAAFHRLASDTYNVLAATPPADRPTGTVRFRAPKVDAAGRGAGEGCCGCCAGRCW
jgi:small GTP-binding protein